MAFYYYGKLTANKFTFHQHWKIYCYGKSNFISIKKNIANDSPNSIAATVTLCVPWSRALSLCSCW